MRHGKEKEKFETGAQRDMDDGKGKPSLISPVLIHHLGVLLAKGAEHYGADNWAKGMPYRRTADSIIRHIYQWLAGDVEEDHLAAVCFGAMCLMTYEEQVIPEMGGRNPLDDRDEGLKKILGSILTSPPAKAKVSQDDTPIGLEKILLGIGICIGCGRKMELDGHQECCRCAKDRRGIR